MVATEPGCGVIECVPNAKSRDQLGRATDANLKEYFVQKYGNEDSVPYQQVGTWKKGSAAKESCAASVQAHVHGWYC